VLTQLSLLLSGTAQPALSPNKSLQLWLSQIKSLTQSPLVQVLFTYQGQTLDEKIGRSTPFIEKAEREIPVQNPYCLQSSIPRHKKTVFNFQRREAWVFPLFVQEQFSGSLYLESNPLYEIDTAAVSILTLQAQALVGLLEHCFEHQNLQLLKTTNASLIRFQEQQVSFMNTITHELRTPLTIIKGFTTGLLDGETGDLNHLQQNYLGHINESCDGLSKLVDDLLDSAKLHSNTFKIFPEEIDFQALITDYLRTMLEHFKRHQVELTIQLPSQMPLLYLDFGRFIQILNNLLNNALKFSSHVSSPKVELTIELIDNHLYTSVSDNGIGIQPEQLVSLFLPFSQLDRNPKKIKGTGLGLSIVKGLLIAQGGDIAVESLPEQNTTFRFHLPEVVRI
jgi:signal transduction histidine kinase